MEIPEGRSVFLLFLGFSQRELHETVDENRNNPKKLLATSQALQALFKASPLAIIALDREGRVTLWNPAAEKVFGWNASEVLGRPNPIVPAEQWDEFLALKERVLRGESFTGAEVTRQRKNGSSLEIILSTAPIYDRKNEIRGILGVAADLTKTRQAERVVHKLAYHDALTGLPNRLLLKDRLDQHLVQANREGRLVGVVFLDLDHFKVINDTLGHAAGDDLLKAVADRIKSCVRKSDTVARLGGDEFVILLPSIGHPEDAAAIAQKIHGIFAEPFELDDQEIFSSTSIGIALYPADAQDADGLVRSADMAMYQAKEQGRNTYKFFSMEMNRKAQELLALETDLHRALERKEFVLHFQPQVDLKSGGTIGVEALLRWRHPQWGLVNPGKFIPVAEETGLILALGEWALRTACARCRLWQKAGQPDLRLAFNLSLRQMRQVDLPDVVEQILKETDFDPALLEMELTEKAFRESSGGPLPGLQGLGAMGVRFTLDKFGAGYFSVVSLRRNPLRRLKIAFPLIRNIPENPDDAAVVRLIIAMGHTLGLKVMAMGVENEKQLDFLQQHGCDEGQGLLFGEPATAEAFETILKNRAGGG
jgi:diguanylate cyclase (GGDEF)-like protein/PAS domain S-box-containing protein